LTTNPLRPQTRDKLIPQVTLYSSVNVRPGFPPGCLRPSALGAAVRLEASRSV
jgi:hypothetical protein